MNNFYYMLSCVLRENEELTMTLFENDIYLSQEELDVWCENYIDHDKVSRYKIACVKMVDQ